jgi:hypothetical protein
MKDGSHNTHSFPAKKNLPKGEARRLTTEQRKVAKHQHTKRVRAYGKMEKKGS